MMTRRTTIHLGKLLGVQIELDYSWFLIFGLVTLSLALSYFPNEYESWMSVSYWLAGGITSLLFFLSVLLHELGHAIVANRVGVSIRRITLFIFGGAAQMTNMPAKPRQEFLIAIAGPVVSIAIAISMGIVTLLSPEGAIVTGIALYLAYINLVLAVFNLIPRFPLDGGRVLRSVVWKLSGNLQLATRVAGGLGRVVAFGFIVLGVISLLSGNIGGGLWIAFIGWFLDGAARTEVQQHLLLNILEDVPVAEAMNTDTQPIPGDTPLQTIVDHRILGDGKRSFLVQDQGQPVGLITIHQIKAVGRDQWQTTTARQAMIPFADVKRVTPATGLWEALRLMVRRGVNQLPVVEKGKVLGLLRREDVIDFVRLQEEFSQ